MKVTIHGWVYPSHLGRLAVQDMARQGGSDWEASSRTIPGTAHHRSFEIFDLSGVGSNKGLDLVIFTGKAHKKRAVQKLTPKHSTTAETVFWIIQLARDLYKVDADVQVTAKVEEDRKSWILKSINSHISQDRARDILTDIKSGTNWTQTERRDTSYSHRDYLRHQLIGEGISFDITVEVAKETSTLGKDEGS